MKQYIKLYEQFTNESKYVLDFNNPNFFISDNTINSFISKLKQLDSTLKYDSSKNGKGFKSKLAYITTSLSGLEIRNLISKFIPKYDNLKIIPLKVNENDIRISPKDSTGRSFEKGKTYMVTTQFGNKGNTMNWNTVHNKVQLQLAGANNIQWFDPSELTIKQIYYNDKFIDIDTYNNILLKDKLTKVIDLNNKTDINESFIDTLSKLSKYTLLLPGFMKILGIASNVLGKKYNISELNNISNYLITNSAKLENTYKKAIFNIINPILKDKTNTNTDNIIKDLLYLLVANNYNNGFNIDSNLIKQETLKLLPIVLKSNGANI